jgi:hypothetical protein
MWVLAKRFSEESMVNGQWSVVSGQWSMVNDNDNDNLAIQQS